ncbi:hypothetical protein HYU11_05310 [Candidatus Woesearchaeota archaeon]|nr:hypothetical protein [Candidatus Woesearchaeota archaeon]
MPGHTSPVELAIDVATDALIRVGRYYQDHKKEQGPVPLMEMFKGELSDCYRFLGEKGSTLDEGKIGDLAFLLRGAIDGIEDSLTYAIGCTERGELWMGTEQGMAATRLFDALSRYNLMKRTETERAILETEKALLSP